MSWEMGLVVVIGLAVMGIVCAFLLPRLAPNFGTRGCQGREWKHRFPGTSKHEIRAFIKLLSDFLGITKTDRLKFGPNDTVLDVYRAVSYGKLGADDLQLVEIHLAVEEQTGPLPEGTSIAEMTLGDLFEHMQRNANKQIHPIAGKPGSG
jgi:hypothetical protein